MGRKGGYPDAAAAAGGEPQTEKANKSPRQYPGSRKRLAETLLYLIYRIEFRQPTLSNGERAAGSLGVAMGISKLKRESVCYTSRLKYYPNEVEPIELMIAEEHIFNPDKVEFADTWKEYKPPKTKSGDDGDTDKCSTKSTDRDGSLQSWNRAQKRAYDLIRCNPDLDMFVTLTFDPKEVDRQSWENIVDKINDWLDNRVRRRGMKYLLCPEYHHDGQSIHFHGLINEKSLKLVNAVNPNTGGKLYRNGKTVYNISDFPFGFTTAIRVTGAEASKACAGYIFKYMRKQGGQRIGGRYFLSGGDLVKPIYVYGNLDYSAVEAPAFALQGVSGGCKVLKGEELKTFLAGSAPASPESPS